MCFKAFYTSIYNIRLGFIVIERKTDREEARTKLAKKIGSPRQSIPSPRQSKQGLEIGVEFTYANRSSPMRS